jgi:hypothetical protein
MALTKKEYLTETGWPVYFVDKLVKKFGREFLTLHNN